MIEDQPAPATNTCDFAEAQLVEQNRQDPKDFSSLYQRYVEPVFYYLFSRVGNAQEAEDLTAQTFLTAFETFHQLRDETRFAPWLFTIARNKAMDYFRHNHHQMVSLDQEDLPSQESDLLSNVIQSEKSRHLSQLIHKLSEEEQELLRLRYLAEMGFPEIALLLHKKEGTVKKSLYRLLERLHRQMEMKND